MSILSIMCRLMKSRRASARGDVVLGIVAFMGQINV